MSKKGLKKFLPCLLTASVLVSFASCGTDNETTGENQSTTEATTAAASTEAATTAAPSTTAAVSTTEKETAKETKKAEKKDKEKKEEVKEEVEETEEEQAVEEETVQEEEPQYDGSFSASDLYISYGGYSLTINQDIASFLQASSVDSSPSCYYDGDDKIFHYGDMDVYTYPYGESDLVLEISLISGNVSTAKGLSVGMTVDDALTMYGTASVSGETYTWSDGNTYMYVNSSGGVITGIGMALSN